MSPSQRMELVEGLNDGIERHWSPVRQKLLNGKIRTLGIPNGKIAIKKDITKFCEVSTGVLNGYLNKHKHDIEAIKSSNYFESWFQCSKDEWLLFGRCG
ncbi:MAG: hypothetical protein QM487_09995 [Candidatus Marithrix sp.]